VYATQDGGETWTSAGLPGVSVNALLPSPDGAWMYAATKAGVFRLRQEAGR
jgi:photosystem II stability/assembly factor-like uncharacterized protein